MLLHLSTYCEISGFRHLEEFVLNVRGELHVLTQDGTASPRWDRWLLQAWDRICKGSAKRKEVCFEYNDFKDTITNFCHFMLHLSKISFFYRHYLSIAKKFILVRTKKTVQPKMKILSSFTHVIPNLCDLLSSAELDWFFFHIWLNCTLKWQFCIILSHIKKSIRDNELLQSKYFGFNIYLLYKKKYLRQTAWQWLTCTYQ